MTTLSPDSANYNKNLFAYCDNNPVTRKDDGGQFWHVIAGALIGGAFELGSQLISNGGNLVMKRYNYLGILLLLAMLLLTACVGKGFTIESVGKDEFDEYSGEFELGLYILPTDDFMTRFPHTDEVYHFLGRYKHKLSILGEETLIITAQYEPDVYEEAKEFCLQSMTLQEVEVPDYNGYHFIENTKLGANPDGDQDNSSNFPWLYNMFAYNDTECKLAFMGYHSPYLTTKETDRMKIINGWPEFIEELFPEIGKGGLAQG